MITSSQIQNSEFKLVKSVFLLFLFQIFISSVGVLLLYLFADVLKLLPTPMNTQSAIIGTLVGSMLFGKWMEKNYPGMLDNKKIKKIALWCTIIYFVLSALFFILKFFVFRLQQWKTPNLGASISLAIFLLFMMTLLYFFTKFSIGRGVKRQQRIRLKPTVSRM